MNLRCCALSALATTLCPLHINLRRLAVHRVQQIIIALVEIVLTLRFRGKSAFNEEAPHAARLGNGGKGCDAHVLNRIARVHHADLALNRHTGGDGFQLAGALTFAAHALTRSTCAHTSALVCTTVTQLPHSAMKRICAAFKRPSVVLISTSSARGPRFVGILTTMSGNPPPCPCVSTTVQYSASYASVISL